MRRRKTVPNEEAILIKACEMAAAGASYRNIAKTLGVGYAWLRLRIDPTWSAAHAERKARWKENRAPKNGRKQSGRYRQGTYLAPISDDELRARKALIPRDTRDLTARLMGDPIPGDPRWQMFQGEAKC